jgi:hypothetical protein
MTSQTKQRTVFTPQRPLLSRRAAAVLGALTVYLKPKLAADAQLDLESVLSFVTDENFRQMKPRIAADIRQQVSGKLGKNASIDQLSHLLDAIDIDDSLVLAENRPAPRPAAPPPHRLGHDAQRRMAIDAAPRSDLSAETLRVIDRVVFQEVAQMVNRVMHDHGMAYDQTTGAVRPTGGRTIAQDASIGGLAQLLDALEVPESRSIYDEVMQSREGSNTEKGRLRKEAVSPANVGLKGGGVKVGGLVTKHEPSKTYEQGTKPKEVNDPKQVKTNKSGNPAEDDDSFDPSIVRMILSACEKFCPPDRLSEVHRFLSSIDPSIAAKGPDEASSLGEGAGTETHEGTSAMGQHSETKYGPGMDSSYSTDFTASDRAFKLRVVQRAWQRCREAGASDAQLAAAVRAIGRSMMLAEWRARLGQDSRLPSGAKCDVV